MDGRIDGWVDGRMGSVLSIYLSVCPSPSPGLEFMKLHYQWVRDSLLIIVIADVRPPSFEVRVYVGMYVRKAQSLWYNTIQHRALNVVSCLGVMHSYSRPSVSPSYVLHLMPSFLHLVYIILSYIACILYILPPPSLGFRFSVLRIGTLSIYLHRIALHSTRICMGIFNILTYIRLSIIY